MQAMDLDKPLTPASERVWHTPELVRFILPHLARERVDLLAIAQVNKAFRTMALPLLVRILDVPLSKVDAFQTLFDRHPELNEHVRFVRIVDDEARHWRDRCHCHSLIRVFDTNKQWRQLKDFLKNRWPAAKFDVTCGVRTSGSVAKALKLSGIEKNIVALRWIADFPLPADPDSDWEDDSDDEIEFRHDQVEYGWDRASQVTQRIAEAQTTSDTKLVSFQIESKQAGILDEEVISFCAWKVMRNVPSAHLHTLNINISSHDAGIPNESEVFKRTWPKLRHLSLNAGPESIEEKGQDELWDDFGEGVVESWVRRHPLLEHLDIRAHSTIPPILLNNDFHDLTSVSLQQCDPGFVGTFLLRLGHKLVELELPRFVTGGGLPAAIRPGLSLPNLRILRAPPRVAAALIDGKHAPQVAHIELKWTDNVGELMLQEWILPASGAAFHLTCLDIQIKFDDFEWIATKLSRTTFDASRFPALVELCMRSCLEYQPLEGDYDESDFDCDCLRQILRCVGPLPSLRALRVQGLGAGPLPTSEPTEIQIGLAPRKLEYLTWVSTHPSRTQYFRVVQAPIRYVPQRWECVCHSPILLTMQQLPASFRAHISDEGEWIQSSKVRHNNTLFDHTMSPPRLPPQP
ncbi:hypothetical protein OC846_002558 [Tilletia horrida]|uniref:Uncharacterized protein n=1 Tax=Tilletia horrida TaxID=155126 RepID=A0AAN6GRZ2_9BASI|nr:hypothetical protein OC846_002558 [Tilletia horrida]KAK0567700.1 hypothetical protein OC861_002554 [Tilletia horrida]